MIFKRELYPLIAIFSSVFILIIGLILATEPKNSLIFLLSTYILCLISCGIKKSLKVIIPFFFLSLFFFLIFYFASSLDASLRMVSRFGALFISLIPSLGISVSSLTRSLNTIKVSRMITLGILISISSLSLIKEEIKKIKEAMKIRNISFWNIRIFFRALLIPLLMRLINISDTLSMSVETRCFSLENHHYTIYKQEYLSLNDLFFIIILISVTIVGFII